MNNNLGAAIGKVRNVDRYTFGVGALAEVAGVVSSRRKSKDDSVVFLVDEFFRGAEHVVSVLPVENKDLLIFVPTKYEPTTDLVDGFVQQIKQNLTRSPCAIVGIGGGSTMDCTKAVSNLLTNKGSATDYQGWDLVNNPGIYKIGVPTISGTGAEATRTCVMTNKANGLKMGMNSEYSVFDQIILDPRLTETVPRDQYFFTGMDAYIHCIESLSGRYRHPIGDAYSETVIRLCREIFHDKDMKSEENRGKLMVASYLGGCAIAMSYVGIVHPFSAGLSVVLGVRHCLANCIVMQKMESFYPEPYRDFMDMIDYQEIELPQGICSDLNERQYVDLFESTIVHEKPLANALGPSFKKVLSRAKVEEIFRAM